MIVGLDSAMPPSAAQADAARAAGVSVWSGYLATRPGTNLYHVWTQADFENARRCGATPIAYASGLDDPIACKALAEQWNVRLCLDVENGIRADGLWVQAWLDASGAGLYGVASVHVNRHAAFHVAAYYPIPQVDPNASWPAWWPRPSAPCGWQWRNTHSEFGVGVDRCWLDPYFAGSTSSNAASEILVSGGLMASADDIMKWIGDNGDPLLRHISGDTDATAQVTASLKAWVDQNGNPLLREIDGRVGDLETKVDALLAAVKALPAPAALTGLSGEITLKPIA